MSDNNVATPSQLIEFLHYDADTGTLTWRERDIKYFTLTRAWKAWNTQYANTEAGSKKSDGYLKVQIFKKQHLAHRVAWAIYYGKYPDGHIDHINGNRSDNRIKNLRDVTIQENARNQKISKINASGHSGIHYYKAGGSWAAYIYCDKKKIHLGYFDKVDDAIAARKQAEKKYGFHPNHGRAND
jgi:hypothetical protein